MSDLETTLYIKLRNAPRHVKRDYASKLAIEGDRGTEALVKLVIEAMKEQAAQDARAERPEAPSVGGWAKRDR